MAKFRFNFLGKGKGLTLSFLIRNMRLQPFKEFVGPTFLDKIRDPNGDQPFKSPIKTNSTAVFVAVNLLSEVKVVDLGETWSDLEREV